MILPKNLEPMIFNLPKSLFMRISVGNPCASNFFGPPCLTRKLSLTLLPRISNFDAGLSAPTGLVRLQRALDHNSPPSTTTPRRRAGAELLDAKRPPRERITSYASSRGALRFYSDFPRLSTVRGRRRPRRTRLLGFNACVQRPAPRRETWKHPSVSWRGCAGMMGWTPPAPKSASEVPEWRV